MIPAGSSLRVSQPKWVDPQLLMKSSAAERTPKTTKRPLVNTWKRPAKSMLRPMTHSDSDAPLQHVGGGPLHSSASHATISMPWLLMSLGDNLAAE